MITKPIFILGAHKSGTTLVRSLLDGHSQLYAIPFETHYFQNMKYWVDNEYRKARPDSLTREEIIESFCSWIHTCNTSEDRYGDSIARGLLDENRFGDYLSSIEEDDDDRARIETYVKAIFYSIEGHQALDTLRFVEKSVENAEFAIDLSILFPEARFIHILRNPYSNLVSLRRHKSIGFGYPILRRAIRTLYNSFYYLYKNQRLLLDYRVVRYEDLVAHPERHVRSLCQFLEIPFEDVLLTPTFRGQPWSGNSTTGERFQGISAEHMDRWKTEINPVEIFYINKVFPFVLRDFHYSTLPMKGSFWRPARGETVKRYIANRLYRYYL